MSYSFTAAGVNHRLGNLLSVAEPSRSFNYPDEKILEKYPEGQRLFKYFFSSAQGSLVPEPTNKHDKNAIKVELNGVHVAYVPADECEKVHRLLQQGSVPRVTVKGGPYKYIENGTVYEDEKSFQIYVDFDDVDDFSLDWTPAVQPIASNPAVKKQSTGAFIAKLVFGALFVITAFTMGSIAQCLTGLILGAGLIAWAVVPKLKEKQAAEAAAFREAAQKERARLENKRAAEQARIMEERALNDPRLCPYCGATTKGKTCEYCGRPLPAEKDG